MARADQIVERLRADARPEILKHFRPDSCVASTRIALEVLREAGIRARPLAVRVIVYNAAMSARIEREGHAPDRASADRWHAEDGSHSLALGLGAEPGDTGFDGHLICVAEERLALDLSLDQVNRPEFGIELAPAAFTVDREFLRAQTTIDARGPDGTRIIYAAMPTNRAYLTAPDWTQRRRWEQIVRSLREPRS